MHFLVLIKVLESLPKRFVKPHLHESIGIMAGLLVNPTWIKRFLSTRGGADDTTNSVDPSLTGQFQNTPLLAYRARNHLINHELSIVVACLQIAAAISALPSGTLATESVGNGAFAPVDFSILLLPLCNALPRVWLLL